jgi:hypothetical protein
MKVRGTTLGVKLTALCGGALTLLASVGLAACTSSPSTTTPSVFSPSVTVSGSVTVSASAGNTSPPGTPHTTPGVSTSSPITETPQPTHTVTHTATATPTATVTSTATPIATVTTTATPVPTAAPVTGGGGTAGFQDTLLLVAGLAAIVAGAGSIFYRRRITRGR